MKPQQLIENVDYPQPEPEPLAVHHRILCEIAERLQELASILPNGTSDVAKCLRRLHVIHLNSERAYKLLIDVLSTQKSLEMSLADLAAQHKNARGEPCSRQAWLQKMQADVAIITDYWPEVGNALAEIMVRRRNSDESHEDSLHGDGKGDEW